MNAETSPSSNNECSSTTELEKPKRTGIWIAGGLLLGILCGVLFGEYCGPLQIIGHAYVGLLQMTVLPYLTVSLVAKLGRLDLHKAQKLGLAALVVLLLLWSIGIVLIVLVSGILPPIEGASFYSPTPEQTGGSSQDILSRFIPANVFRSLSDENVPAVVVFCLFFGSALMMVPGKEPLLDFLDLCSISLGQVNQLLVRLAPLGLFTLTAAAAGTLRIEELSRLQAYLLMFTVACLTTAFGILPILVSSLTPIRYRDFIRAVWEPILIAIAAGKLFVVLPQITENCEALLRHENESASATGRSTPSVLVPLAYPFPHLGKTLAFVFVSFGAWYTGQGLTATETTTMAATGTVSSFASPLVTLPYLLDEYRLPQDLMALFILPGFITTRMADVVGVVHLSALTVVVTQLLRRQTMIRWARLAMATGGLILCLALAGGAGRWYLALTTVESDLDARLLSLEIPNAHDRVVVFRKEVDVPGRTDAEDSGLERIMREKLLRVGYSPDRMPYCFFNRKQQLVGLDVELLHRLAARMQVRLEFVPYTSSDAEDQLASGKIDILIGGIVMMPERLLRVGMTQPYQTATLAFVARDHRRGEFETWEELRHAPDLRLGTSHEDIAAAVQLYLPDASVEAVDSFTPFFSERDSDLDGLIVAAEVGSVWSILHPENTVVVPEPITTRPVAMAVRTADRDLLRFLDRWLDFERHDGSLDRLRIYWSEGGGAHERPPRWSVMQNVLHLTSPQ